jgi:integrase
MAESTARKPSRRSRGEGSVYKTKEGRWRASLLVTDPRTGRMVRRVVSGRSKAEAVRGLDALKQGAAAGAPLGSGTVAEFLTAWLVAVRPTIRPSTFRGYSSHVRTYWKTALGAIPLARLAPTDVESAMSALSAAPRRPHL